MWMAEPRTFRATTEAWLGQLLLPLVFFTLLTVTAVNKAWLSPLVAVSGLALLMALIGPEYLRPMLRNWLEIDRRTISGSLNGHTFEIFWIEVLAAWLLERRNKRFLCLGTKLGTLVIPLRFFDDQTIWEIVRAAVPPEALEASAIERLPDYNQWSAARDEALDSEDPRAITDHWIKQLAGWAGVSVFFYGAMDAFQNSNLAVTLIFVALSAASALLLLSWGVTVFRGDLVARHTLLRAEMIRWDEVHQIEVDPINAVVVLIGDGRQMVLPGPGIWRGKERAALLAIVMAQAERRKIPLRRTMWALARFSRNVRVKSDHQGQ